MRRAIAGIGRTLVTVGLLILLFVVYQLWGTGIFTARAQASLKSTFEKELSRAGENDTVGPVPTTVLPVPTTVAAAPGATTSTTIRHDDARPAPRTPAEGEVEGSIAIPSIGINFWFVEGTSRDDLKKGPGHYPGTPIPGTIGNAAIAGHRTTYLHPFWGLDNVKVGDDIIIKTLAGTFVYRVSTPWFKVKATDVWVVANTPDPELTLTACHPKGSAEFRIVIKAKLVLNKSSKPTVPIPVKPATRTSRTARTAVQAGLAEGLSGQTRSLLPSVAFGILAALVGLAWWWSFRRWRHPFTWLIGVTPFLVALIPFYVYLERALPAGY